MKVFLITLSILFAVLRAHAQSGLSPTSVDLGNVRVQSKVTFRETFQEFGLCRSCHDRIHLHCQPGLSADPSDFYVDYEDQQYITFSFDTNVVGCYGYSYPYGVLPVSDSFGSLQPLNVTAYVYDPRISGKFHLRSDTLGFGVIPMYKNSSLSLSLDADSLGMTYRKLLAYNIRQPFSCTDSVDPNICRSFTNTVFHFTPTSSGHYIDTALLVDPLTNDTLPLILIGDAYDAGVVEDVAPAFKLYPNPCDHNLTIELPQDETAHIEIRDLLGQTVYSSHVTDEFPIDCSKFPDGVYFVRISSDGVVLSRRVVVAH